MRFLICVLCVCSINPVGKSLEIQTLQDQTHEQDPSPPLPFSTKTIPTQVAAKPSLEFPKKQIDVSTPLVIGNDPKNSKLPPRIFPTKQDKDFASPSIISNAEVKTTEINHSKGTDKQNSTIDKMSDKVNMTLPENATHPDISHESKVEQATAEQEDMLNSKYKGGQDVDELRPGKKASEKDEKKVEKDMKSEVSITSTLDKKGPKLMNETKTKSGESMFESTSKMMAVSSSVLANTQPKEHGIIEPVKTVVSVLLTVVALLCFGMIGLLVWKKIAMRRFGRDVLINEEDFDEVADMHTFDRAQIQIT